MIISKKVTRCMVLEHLEAILGTMAIFDFQTSCFVNASIDNIAHFMKCKKNRFSDTESPSWISEKHAASDRLPSFSVPCISHLDALAWNDYTAQIAITEC